MTNSQFKKIFVNSLLTSICLLSAYLIWNEHQKLTNINTTRQSRASITTQASSTPVKNVDQFQIPDASEFSGIVKRPLFNMNRRPSFNSGAPELKSTNKKNTKSKPKTQLALNAVVISPDRKLAIFQTGKNTKPVKVALGDSINNWVLSDISPHSVRLSKGRQVKVLELEIKSSKWKKAPDKTKAKSSRKSVPKLPKATPPEKPENSTVETVE